MDFKIVLGTRPSINHYSVLLFSVFILLPFFDAINGYLVVNGVIASAGLASPSQLGRFLVSAFLVYLLGVKKIGVLPILLIIYFLSVEIISALYHQSQYGFSYGIISAYKLTYLLILTIVLKHYVGTSRGFLLLTSYIKYNLLIIASLLLFSTITGVGNSTYGFGFGTKSFFSSGNGLGLYLGIGTLILIGLKYHKLISIDNRTLIFLACSIALIGSKTAMILSATNLLYFIYGTKYRFIFILSISLMFMFFLPKIIDVLSVVFDVILGRLSNEDNILIYLASGRLDYVVGAFDVYFNSDPNPFRYIFGAGAYTSFQNPFLVNEFDTLETDLFDLFFMYGLVSVILYLVMIGYILYKLRRYKVFFIGMLLLSLHSVLAGHVLFNGMSSVCFALFFCISHYLIKQGRINDKMANKVRG